MVPRFHCQGTQNLARRGSADQSSAAKEFMIIKQIIRQEHNLVEKKNIVDRSLT